MFFISYAFYSIFPTYVSTSISLLMTAVNFGPKHFLTPSSKYINLQTDIYSPDEFGILKGI